MWTNPSLRFQIGYESSDDEPLEDEDDDLAETWRSISRGDLPFDIKLLKVLCLLGTGTYYFVAMNLLEQVMSLSDVSLFAPTAYGGPPVATDDGSAWRTFSKRFSGEISLTKSYLLSSVVDALVKKRSNLSWTGRALRLIKSHLKAVDSKYGLETILAESTEENREQTLKIMFAMMTLLLHCARLRLPQLDDLDAQDIKAVETAVSEVIAVIKFMVRFKSIIWLPDYADWSLPRSSADVSAFVNVQPFVLGLICLCIRHWAFCPKPCPSLSRFHPLPNMNPSRRSLSKQASQAHAVS